MDFEILLYKDDGNQTTFIEFAFCTTNPLDQINRFVEEAKTQGRCLDGLTGEWRIYAVSSSLFDLTKLHT